MYVVHGTVPGQVLVPVASWSVEIFFPLAFWFFFPHYIFCHADEILRLSVVRLLGGKRVLQKSPALLPAIQRLFENSHTEAELSSLASRVAPHLCLRHWKISERPATTTTTNNYEKRPCACEQPLKEHCYNSCPCFCKRKC